MPSPITDPVEHIIAAALDEAGIAYVHSGEDGSGLPLTRGLDFYLPGFECWIECKAYHSDRISGQMAKAADIIVIQGLGAARAFSAMLKWKMR